MADFDIRICPSCGTSFVEDSQMYQDPDRCPACGTDLRALEADTPALVPPIIEEPDL